MIAKEMNRRLTVTKQLVIPHPAPSALAVVQDIKSIEVTERKARVVEVMPEDDHRGRYRVKGRFAGYPWKGEFEYRLHDKGFHSVDVFTKSAEPAISGGFFVVPLGDDHCLVVHYEQYELPAFLVPFKPLLAAYLRSSMRTELREIERLTARMGSGGSQETPLSP